MIEDFSKNIVIVPIYSAINIYASEKARLRKNGLLIDDFDILIGATAVANDLILVTENDKHLNRIENIRIENWINR